MAESLASDEISVILVPDSHVFGLMARVNKVIVGCDTVYPDGSLKAQVGTYGVMLAAKHFSIPVSSPDLTTDVPIFPHIDISGISARCRLTSASHRTKFHRSTSTSCPIARSHQPTHTQSAHPAH